MEKKIIIGLFVFFTVFLANVAFAYLVENIDYYIDFQETSPSRAAVLHVYFKDIFPDIIQAEEIVKQQLNKYGDLVIKSNKLLSTVKSKKRYKNIIGSAWYISDIDPANPIKIEFRKAFSAYVWIGKTKTIITFPQYVVFLKKIVNEGTK